MKFTKSKILAEVYPFLNDNNKGRSMEIIHNSVSYMFRNDSDGVRTSTIDLVPWDEDSALNKLIFGMEKGKLAEIKYSVIGAARSIPDRKSALKSDMNRWLSRAGILGKVEFSFPDGVTLEKFIKSYAFDDKLLDEVFLKTEKGLKLSVTTSKALPPQPYDLSKFDQNLDRLFTYVGKWNKVNIKPCDPALLDAVVEYAATSNQRAKYSLCSVNGELFMISHKE